jgi:hypothetical protein
MPVTIDKDNDIQAAKSDPISTSYYLNFVRILANPEYE